MNGCNIRTIPRKTMTSVELCCLLPPLHLHSVNQLWIIQYTRNRNHPIQNCTIHYPLSANSYFSMFSVTFSNTSLKRFKIHLSIIDALLTSISSKWNCISQLHQRKATGIPNLIDKVPACFDFFIRVTQILPRSRIRRQEETQCIHTDMYQ